MAQRFDGKVVLITGGTSGIGLGVAKRMAAEGARVVVTGRRRTALDAAVAEIGHGSTGVQGDVSDLGDLDRLYDGLRRDLGRVDVLFANAGAARRQTLAEITDDSYEETFGTNVKGVLFTVQKCVPLMPDGSTIIVNASVWTIKGVEGFGLLSATKAAVRSLVRTWANELRHRGIRVNVVSPGIVLTPAIEKAMGGVEAAKAHLDRLAKDVPLGRVGQPDDIAGVVAFLASDDASYIDGVELFVDGGMTQV